MRTDNYIYNQGWSPEGTKTIIPAKFRIYSVKAGQKMMSLIGNCSTLSINESRTIEPVRGIGKGIKIAELVPGNTEPIELQTTLFALYLGNVMQIFGYIGGVDGFVRSLAQHQWPFDIRQEVVLSNYETTNPAANGNVPGAVGNGTQEATTDGIFNANSGFRERCITTIYEQCWMSNLSQESQDTTAFVSENCTIMATTAVDGRYSGRVGSLTGNEPSSGGGSNIFQQGNLLGNLFNI